MFRLKIERAAAPMWIKALLPLAAVLFTFALTSLFLIWAKANPFTAYYYFLISPLSSQVSALEILVKTTPLLLTGASVAFAFSAGYWNIGAEGQLYAGAIAGAWLGIVLKNVHPALGIPLMVLGGFLAGALWALGPALLKVRLNVDEVVTTLLLNSVILFLVSYLLNDVWRDPVTMWPQSPEIAAGTVFFKLIPHSRLHLGFIIALAVIAIEWFVLKRTPLGLRMRAIGMGKDAARFAGINVDRTVLTVALISGGIAGLAGVSEVAGIHFHLIDSISDGLGYTGVVIATLGGLNPLGVGLAALFLGLINTGAQTLSSAMEVPVYLGQVVNAVLLLTTLAMFIFPELPHPEGNLDMEAFLIGLLAATLRVATPLIFGTLGELFSERVGVLNLGIEGTMFLGAFTGFAVASQTGSLWVGVLAAILAGLFSGWMMSLLTVRLGVNQHVSGLGITLLWTGFALFGFRLIFGNSQVNPSIQAFKTIPLFGNNPILGPIFNQNFLTFVAFACVPVVWWIINRTRFGLNIRATGENPEAADAAGLNVYAIRTQALMIGGALMSLAGAFLSLAQLGSFTYGIIAGRGWVCIALIIFANWEAERVLWGALLFGGVAALQLRLQTMGFKLPYELFLALPYLVTILALILAGRNASAPASLLKPYRRE